MHLKNGAFMRKGIFYLGRVVKLGTLTPEKLEIAIFQPKILLIGTYHYTFTDTKELSVENTRVIYAKLSKYTPRGETKTVSVDEHKEETTEIENLLYASSPFVYVPSLATIAYPHIWHRLQRSNFERAFSKLIEEKHDGFFVDCSIKPLSDLNSFIKRLSSLKTILEIDATLNPPNPIFGPRWKSLRDYIRRRNADEVKITEKTSSPEGLSSQLAAVSEDTMGEKDPKERKPITTEPGDAAVLMAIDGYGKAKVRGTVRNRQIILRTRETQISFPFDRDASPEKLGSEAYRYIRRVHDKRQLDHGGHHDPSS
jgi:hypothetical protein